MSRKFITQRGPTASRTFQRTSHVRRNLYERIRRTITADTFRRRLHRLNVKTGLARLHPHQFRHTFIRNYILNGGDLFTVQKIVDHADIKTTRTSTGTITARLKI